MHKSLCHNNLTTLKDDR